MALKRTPVTGCLLLCLVVILSACGQASAKLRPTPTSASTLPMGPKGWNTVASPRVDEEGNLADVTVISAHDAWAVGSYVGVDALQRTLTEHWDGAAWSVVASPNPSTVANELDAIAGISANDIWAVGQALTSAASQLPSTPLIEHWDGKSWTVIPNPTLGQGEHFLSGITAVSPMDAWAVGYTMTQGPNGQTESPLIVHWDGSVWKAVASPDIPASAGNAYVTLNAVTAVASNDVWAVGGDMGAGEGALIEHWNGSTWSVTQDNTSSAANPDQMGGLTSISADGPNDVWAVGSGLPPYEGGCGYANSRVMEHWDGQRWSYVTFPIPPTPNGQSTFSFNHIAAAAPNDVWAVGGVKTGARATTPIAEHWDGTQWSIASLPSVATAIGFASVAARAGAVLAVGQTAISNGFGATVVGQWTGSQWSRVASPSPGTLSNELNGISVIGSRDIWAVGDSAAGALSEHWDGASWSVIPTVNGAATDNYLNAVAGTGVADVWAVGSGAGKYVGQGVAEHWDGSAWTSDPLPTANGTPIQPLFGVAALSRNDAWAVGMGGAIHWTGSAWANSTGAPGSLLGVAAVSAHDVWAVGGNPPQNCGGIAPAIIAHWDGQRWSNIANTPQGTLYSVSAVSSSDVWAVGDGSGGSLIMHWDGKQWAQTMLPGDLSKQGGYLQCVFARASDDVWVVGGSYTNRQTLILHLDGHTWTSTAIKAPGQSGDSLNAVAAVSSGEVWAVGSYAQQYGVNQALIERYIA